MCVRRVGERNDRVHLKGEAAGDFLNPRRWEGGKVAREGDRHPARPEVETRIESTVGKRGRYNGSSSPRCNPAEKQGRRWRQPCSLLLLWQARISWRRATAGAGPLPLSRSRCQSQVKTRFIDPLPPPPSRVPLTLAGRPPAPFPSRREGTSPPAAAAASFLPGALQARPPPP